MLSTTVGSLMKIPDWWEAVLLSAAAWRSFQLISADDILDWPRRKILRLGTWQQDGDPIPSNYRSGLGNFVKCSYCMGFWVALAWWGAWQITGHWTLVFAVPFALSTGVIALARVYSD